MTVTVGQDEEIFSFDFDSLVLKPTYFQEGLADRRNLMRGRIDIMLPGFSPHYFKMYLHWVYESRLDYKALGYCPNGNPRFVDLSIDPPAGIDPSVAKERQTKQAEILADRLKRLWELGGFLGNVEFQDALSKEFVTWYIDKPVLSSMSEPTLALTEKQTGRRIDVGKQEGRTK